MHASLAAARKNLGFWQLALLATIALSILIGAAGFAFKSRIVEALPAANDPPGPPLGILHFVDSAIDSWKPMKLALRVSESPAGGQIFETLREFQLTGNSGQAGDLSYFDDSRKFQYPLTSLAPMVALETIGLGSLRALNLINLGMFLTCLAATAYLAVLLARDAGLIGKRGSAGAAQEELIVFSLAAIVGLTFWPPFMALVKGNIQVWINCFFALACVAWVKRREFVAGILIALATAIKPQLGALLVWALLWQRWSFAAGFAAAGIPIAAFAVAYFGLHNNLAYLDVMRTMSQHGESFVYNESVNGIVHRLIETDPSRFLLWSNDYGPYRTTAYVFTLVAAVLFAVVAFLPAWLRRGEEPSLFDFSLASICFTIGSPIVWPMHYGILLPIFVAAFIGALKQPEAERRTTLVILGAAWLLCASYLPFARLIYESPWNIVSNPRFFGALLLMIVVFRVGRVWPRTWLEQLRLPLRGSRTIAH